ncbi:MAG: 4'-phosphopantetheinyl transferase superfamily protein [Deltaproteobacteria bacterium]|nr:4'-phosphopantetheinyl transferase superfamily protein [Deltaproteobacteria bacterium]
MITADDRARVEVFYARTDALADDPWALDVLDEAERARHTRYLFDHSKRTLCASHALVRAVLGRVVSEAPERLVFEHNAYGRPSLSAAHGCPWVSFNLSHTEQMVCLAVASHREVGVDVEDALRDRRTMDVADRFFSPAEVMALRELEEYQQNFRFFAYWTLKESYIKARGMGLAIPLDLFSFELAESEDARALEGPHPRWLRDRVELRCDPSLHDLGSRWEFSRAVLSERHVAALALERTEVPATVRFVEVTSFASVRAMG